MFCSSADIMFRCNHFLIQGVPPLYPPFSLVRLGASPPTPPGQRPNGRLSGVFETDRRGRRSLQTGSASPHVSTPHHEYSWCTARNAQKYFFPAWQVFATLNRFFTDSTASNAMGFPRDKSLGQGAGQSPAVPTHPRIHASTSYRKG